MFVIPKALTRRMQRLLRRRGFEIRQLPKTEVDAFPDLDQGFRDIVNSMLRVTKGFDLTEYTTYKVIEYLLSRGITGDLVECGVYRGRQILMMAHTLMARGVNDRDIYLYDTFAGMTAPTSFDWVGDPSRADQNRARWEAGRQPDGSNLYKLAALEEVQRNVFSSGYPRDRMTFIAGDVEQTIVTNRHARIAFLRLDTDWYESTKVELERLYDRLVIGGVLVIDDYGRWQGSRKAADEFFGRLGDRAPMLVRSTPSERVCVKVC